MCQTSTHRVSFALAHEDLGDAKVADLDDHLVLVQQDVLRLEVPVQDELVVHVVQRQQDLHKEVHDGVLVQQRVAALLYVVGQGSTLLDNRANINTTMYTPQVTLMMYKSRTMTCIAWLNRI